MKNKTSHKTVNSTQNMVNYTRSKDAYDGNMELTNLKNTRQNVEPLPESSRPRKDGPGGA